MSQYQFQSITPQVKSRDDINALAPNDAYTYFRVESAIWKARMMLVNRGEWGAEHNMPAWALAKLMHAVDYLTEQQQTARIGKE